MNWRMLLLFCVLVAVLPLASCSGIKSGSCSTGCGGGSANISVTLYDTPPTGVSVLSFSLPIAGISLTPSTGSDVSIYSPTAIVPNELTRLQTDSAAIVTAAPVPAGTYTAIKITILATSGVFVNYSPTAISYTLNGSSATCAQGAVCNLPAGAATTVTAPLNLTLSANQSQWIGLDAKLNNAILTTGGISVDFTQLNTITATTTPRTGTPSGGVDTVEDFIGKVTAVSASSITLQSGMTGKSVTAAIAPSTGIDAAPTAYSNCPSANTCLRVGSVVSLDALLSSTGTFTATEIDVLDYTAGDEIEGIIYPTSQAGVFRMILADKLSTSGNAVLGAATTTYGTGIFLTVNSTSNYSIDGKTLSTAAGFTPIGFAGSGDLLGGQVVRAKVTGVTSTASGITATATNVLLRWSRISATVNLTTGNTFTLTGVPAYISALNPLLGLTPLVYTYTPGTQFDGITGTGDPKFQSAAVAIRALYLNSSLPTFQAAEVRVP